MKINDIAYPTITEKANYILSKKLNSTNYAINNKIDESIIFSCGSGKYAPYGNIDKILYQKNDNPDSEKEPKIIEFKRNDLQKMFLLSADDYFSTFNRTILDMYNLRWAYGITSDKTISASLIKGLNFFNDYLEIEVTSMANTIDISNLSDDTILTDYNVSFVTVRTHKNNITYTKHDELPFTTFNFNETNGNFENIKDNYFIYYNPPLTTYGSTVETMVFGQRQYTGFYIKSDYMDICVGANFAIYKKPVGSVSVYSHMPFFSGTVKDLKSMVATFGMPFSFKYITEINKQTIIDNDNIFIPIIENNGTYQGRYATGKDEKEKTKQVVENWEKDLSAPYNNGVSDFDNIDNNNYTDKMVRGTGRQSGQFNNSYVITEQNMKKLQKLLNVKSIDDTTPEIYKNLLFMGSNPMECITSINWYPVGIPIGAPTNLILGSYTTDIAVTTVQSFTKTVNMGFCDIKPIHENHYFLNFEPYSYYLLYAPFCGWYPLDSKKVVGKNIQLYMNIDFLSGTCAVEVWIDSSIETVLNGIISAPVSVQAFSQNDYFNSRINSIKNIGSDIINSSGAIASNIMQKNPVGTATSIAGGALSLTSDIFSFVRPEMRYNSITANTANLSTYNPTSAYIARYTVTEQIPTNYNSTVGYACEFTANVNTLSGYTVFSNFNCNGISATDIEKNEIKALAENGIYI